MTTKSTHPTLEKRITVDGVISAIRASKGMVSIAARKAGIDRTTMYDYIKKYPAVATALQDEREATTDTAELALYSAIQEKEAWAVCFYLKTQGKSRGYVERTEQMTFDLSNATDEQIDRIANGEDPAKVMARRA